MNDNLRTAAWERDRINFTIRSLKQEEVTRLVQECAENLTKIENHEAWAYAIYLHDLIANVRSIEQA